MKHFSLDHHRHAGRWHVHRPDHHGQLEHRSQGRRGLPSPGLRAPYHDDDHDEHHDHHQDELDVDDEHDHHHDAADHRPGVPLRRGSVPGRIGPLPPGTYGKLKLLNGGTLSLRAGTFAFCDVKLGRSAALTTQGPTIINVAGDVVIGTASRFGPAAGTAPVSVNVGGKLV